MIIKNVCFFLEAMSIVICLHHLYGVKFKLDILTISFLSVDMIIMAAINFFRLPETYLVTMIVYPIIVLYCGYKFGFNFRSMLWNMILCVIVIGGIQMLCLMIAYCLYKIQNFSDYKLLFINGMTFAVVLIVLPIFRLNRMSKFSQDNGKIIILVTSVCMAWISIWVLNYKNLKTFELKETILLFISIILILILADQLNKYKIKAKEIETELKMHEIYSEPFKGLVDDIRLKQHEFDNHINAIYSLHYSCKTFDELVESQNIYCKQITRDNRFNKLLAPGNSIIRGFLYTRFVEIEKKGIEISYNVILSETKIEIPVYKMVEVLSNLFNNAVEALETDEERNKIYIEIVDASILFIEVRNESPYISFEILNKFFNKGYSKKGDNRGLGLYNLKHICEEYKLDIIGENVEIDGNNWLSIKIKSKNKS